MKYLGFNHKQKPNGTATICYYKDEVRWFISDLLTDEFHLCITSEYNRKINYIHEVHDIYRSITGRNL